MALRALTPKRCWLFGKWLPGTSPLPWNQPHSVFPSTSAVVVALNFLTQAWQIYFSIIFRRILTNLTYTAVIHRAKWHICNCDHLDIVWFGPQWLPLRASSFILLLLSTWSPCFPACGLLAWSLLLLSYIYSSDSNVQDCAANKLLLLTAWLVQMSQSHRVATELAEAVTIFLDYFLMWFNQARPWFSTHPKWVFLTFLLWPAAASTVRWVYLLSICFQLVYYLPTLKKMLLTWVCQQIYWRRPNLCFPSLKDQELQLICCHSGFCQTSLLT